MDKRKYLSIYILHTMGLGIPQITQVMKCSEHTVMRAENWIKEDCTYAQACDLVNDARIQRIVDRDLSDYLSQSEKEDAQALVGDDILLYYSLFPPDEAGYDPALIRPLKVHWRQLRSRAAAMREELKVPANEDLISPEMCRHIIRSRRIRRAILPADQWRSSLFAPWQLRRSRGTGDTQVQLPVETQTLFPALHVHLIAEFPEFDPLLSDWKSDAGQLMDLCLAQARRITLSCAEETGLRYIGGTVRSGLFETAPAYICRMLLGPDRTAPRWEVTTPDDVTWRMVPRDLPAWGLGAGSRDRLDRCAGQIDALISTEMANPVWQDIAARRDQLAAHGAALQDFLESVIVRGTFQGFCPWCPVRHPEETSGLV